MNAMPGSLEFLPRGSAEFTARCVALARASQRGLLLHPWTAPMQALAARLSREAPGTRVCVHQGEAGAAGATAAAAWEDVDAVVLDSEPDDLPAHLLQLVDLPGLRVVAPLTGDFFRNRPLFLVSIPKSGTHLLNKLVETMGYGLGIVHDEFARPGQWYCLEYTNSHTVARDFFVDTVRRAPYGNRYHAFTRSPVLFIYRNPLDVLVSEANYYHREGKTAFAGYLSGLAFEERVHRLLDDPWLLGSIRDRIGGFAPWLDFPNVIPLSFEEIVGEEGGGSREEQLRLLWSLQLKLQIPGSPQAFADSVFDRESPTFYQGRIGAWRASLSEQHLSRFRALDQDFMKVFGYDLGLTTDGVPSRADEFRRRPLRVGPPLHDNVPITLEYNHLGFNLVRFAGWLYAVPQATGPGFDLRGQDGERLDMIPRERTLPALKHRLLVEAVAWGGNMNAMASGLAARLAGQSRRNPARAVVRGLLKAVARMLRGGNAG